MHCKLACKCMGFFILLRSEATERTGGTRGSALYGGDVKSEAIGCAGGTRGSALYGVRIILKFFLKRMMLRLAIKQ